MTVPENVTVIPATRAIGTQTKTNTMQKTRVAAYCRVSTEFEEQESSYEMQVEHYTNYIQSKPEWELVEVYADDGISATNTTKRESFNRMIDDCRQGKIDMILTKSISRFSRNTVDCLKYTRELKDLNISVFFEKENINTLDTKGEVLMTIMAALAQQESESLSANVRLGIQFRNQAGKVRVNHNRFLGYTKDKEGKLIIVPEEADIVRRIYAEYMEGKSMLQIKRDLERDRIPNGAGNRRWHETNIRQILTNEKYIGDALIQKTFTLNTLEKKRVTNDGYAPKYYVEGDHEAIIDRDVFMRVQAELARRANIVTGGKRKNYNGRYALSGIVFCGHCEALYRRIKWNNRGKKTTVWRCVSRVLKKESEIDCPSRTIKEEDLQNAVVTAVNDAWNRRGAVLPVLKENVRAVLADSGAEERLEAVNVAIKNKQAELLQAGIGQTEMLETEMISLRDRKQEILNEITKNKEIQERVDEMTAFLNEQTETITEYSEPLVRKLVAKVTVYDEKIEVEFKTGLKIEVET